MSDTKLRDLERRWKETGTVVDEAAFLLERVRVGDLTRERLGLAAYCGHEGASRALGVQPEAVPEDAEAFLTGIAMRWGAMACLRAALDAIGCFLPEFEARNDGDDRPRRAITATADWLECPCDRHALAAQSARAAAWTAFHRAQRMRLVARAASMLSTAPQLLSSEAPPHATYPALPALRFVVRRPDRARQARDGMRDGLVAWTGVASPALRSST